ncbi:hypothetical protein V8C86DRAFT_3110051 [Haematococcus lacustris]
MQATHAAGRASQQEAALVSIELNALGTEMRGGARARGAAGGRAADEQLPRVQTLQHMLTQGQGQGQGQAASSRMRPALHVPTSHARAVQLAGAPLAPNSLWLVQQAGAQQQLGGQQQGSQQQQGAEQTPAEAVVCPATLPGAGGWGSAGDGSGSGGWTRPGGLGPIQAAHAHGLAMPVEARGGAGGQGPIAPGSGSRAEGVSTGALPVTCNGIPGLLDCVSLLVTCSCKACMDPPSPDPQGQPPPVTTSTPASSTGPAAGQANGPAAAPPPPAAPPSPPSSSRVMRVQAWERHCGRQASKKWKESIR